jgi:hypothetical protein
MKIFKTYWETIRYIKDDFNYKKKQGYLTNMLTILNTSINPQTTNY